MREALTLQTGEENRTKQTYKTIRGVWQNNDHDYKENKKKWKEAR